MNIIYESQRYSSDYVTGKYVRLMESTPNFVFRVFETSTCESGYFKGMPGRGPTIREYDTNGENIPDNIKQEAILTKQMVEWDIK